MILAKAKSVPADIWPGLGWAGGLLLLALIIATLLLWHNMNGQLKKVKVPTAAEFAERDRVARAARKTAASAGDAGGASGGSNEAIAPAERGAAHPVPGPGPTEPGAGGPGQGQD